MKERTVLSELLIEYLCLHRIFLRAAVVLRTDSVVASCPVAIHVISNGAQGPRIIAQDVNILHNADMQAGLHKVELLQEHHPITAFVTMATAARVPHRAPLSVARVAAPQRASVRAQAAPEDLTLKIKLKAYEVPVLEESVKIIRSAVGDTGANVSGAVRLPTRRRIYCVLRSPHVNSNSREHFEIRTHQRLIHVKGLNKEAVQSLMSVNLPAGVDCKVKV